MSHEHEGDQGPAMRPDVDLRIYLAVAFGTTWLVLLPLALEGAGLLAGPVPPALHVLGGIGPALGAVVASRRAGLAAAWRAGLRRLPGEAGSWLLAVGVPAVLLVLGLLVVGLPAAGGGSSPAVSSGAEPVAWSVVVAVLYGVLEETGWRGYLLPRLQARHSALVASVTLGAIHVLWHAPMFLYRYQPGVGPVLGFSTSLIAATVFFTHLYNRSGGSVPVTMAFHVGWNVAILVGARGSDAVAAVMSVGLMVVAVGVLLRYGGRTLARAPAVQLTPVSGRSDGSGR